MRSPAQQVAFTLNGRRVEVHVDPVRRLADVLREDLGLTGTKVGCNAGDCGACTVRLDGRQVCACTVAAAGRWLWRIFASTRRGAFGGSHAMKFTACATSRPRSRSAASPTPTVLRAGSRSTT